MAINESVVAWAKPGNGQRREVVTESDFEITIAAEAGGTSLLCKSMWIPMSMRAKGIIHRQHRVTCLQ